MYKNKFSVTPFSLTPHVDLSKIESGVGTPANALTPEEYEKAWKEIVGDYNAFFKAVEKIVPLIDEHGAPRSAYDIFQDIAQHVYEVPVVRCCECIHKPHYHGRKALADDPNDFTCPYLASGDPWESECPDDDFFCAYGEKRKEE